ncbi:DUF58 domain-containing protein [Bacillus sp. ISL-47]|uniref:DUF58 domain-containing protein n=1 Tax=Bacillus sp. ISL-47 TaxID=2819130 RepID=UPI001BE5B840|nr:DUF58 domain-containing protein [Bacillus sp. ISL-47]MBT2687804.1 DUF58 domain-containing protein [Bacillus sp. ISL-47]MBT2708119.1 DUF58 domain-containing protein [Pseudomonas sp. ISL-84]
MEWKKFSVEDNSLSLTGILGIFLLLASFYFKSWQVFLAAVIFLLLISANSFYMKNLGKNLVMQNPKKRLKFFPNEEGNWTLKFENKGLPILRGELKVFFDDSVAPLNYELAERLGRYELNIPFTLNYNEQKIVTIPFAARKRGVAKIRRLELYVPHFLGFGETILEYRAQIKQEALVYPVRLPVKNKLSFFKDRQGISQAAYSLFEDRLSPAGIRQYVSTDSFNRIHWKASARKQNLQTKIFDRVAETGWNISLNVSEGHSISGHLEELISGAADMAYYWVKQEIPFSLCINIRVAGSTPFYFIPAGSGKEHLQKVLETLALVDNHSSLYPYEKMLSFYGRKLAVQPYFIHAGQSKPSTIKVFNLINRKGALLYELYLSDKDAVIQPLQLKITEVAGR